MPHFLARFRLLTLSLLAGALTMHAAEPLVLVRDGQPVATIVVQADAPKPQQAAEALQTYIARMTGATLPLVTDTDPAPDGVTIQVGTTRAAAELDLPIPAGFDPTPRPDYFEEEGYLIRTVDDMLIIAGNNDGSYYGTLYGAYAFLRGLGCRWYFPGDYGEIVPRQQTIQVEPMDILSKPDFTARAVSLGGWLPSSKEEKAIYQEWQYKVGMTVERPYPVAGDGFLAYLVPPGEYFDEHPEYFAMGEDGQRHRGKSVRHTMLCLSNEAVFETAVKTLSEMRDGTREFGYYKNGMGISPPDGVPYCYCKECQAASQNFQYPRYVHRTSQSEECIASVEMRPQGDLERGEFSGCRVC